jgi:hypothetical protein
MGTATYLLYTSSYVTSHKRTDPRRLFNPLNTELNPICYLLALLPHHFLHVNRIRVKSLTLRLLMSYIYDISILRVNGLTLILLTWRNGELIMPANGRWDLIQRLKG